jgi:hypothetical protein
MNSGAWRQNSLSHDPSLIPFDLKRHEYYNQTESKGIWVRGCDKPYLRGAVLHRYSDVMVQNCAVVSLVYGRGAVCYTISVTLKATESFRKYDLSTPRPPISCWRFFLCEKGEYNEETIYNGLAAVLAGYARCVRGMRQTMEMRRFYRWTKYR